MAKTTQGSINLTLGVNASFDKINVDLEGLTKSLEKQLNKSELVSKGVTTKLAKQAKAIGDALKINVADERASSKGALGVADALKRELTSTSKLLNQDGKIVQKELEKWVKEMATLKNLPAQASGKGGLLSPLLSLSGKKIGAAKTDVAAFKADLNARLKEVDAFNLSMERKVSVSQSRVRDLTRGVARGPSEDVKALAEVLQLVSDFSKTGVSKNLSKDVEAVSQRIARLRKGYRDFAKASADTLNNPMLEEKYGFTSASADVKRKEILQVLEAEKATLKEVQATDKLYQARKKLADATLDVRKAYQSKDTTDAIKVTLLKEQYALARNVERLTSKTSNKNKGRDRSFRVSDQLKGLGQDIKQSKNLEAAKDRVQQAQDRIDKTTRGSLAQQITAQQGLINAILSRSKVLGDLYDLDRKGAEASLEALLKRKAVEAETAKGLKKTEELTKALNAAKADTKAYDGGNQTVRLDLLKEELRLVKALDKHKVAGVSKDQRETQAQVDKQKTLIDNSKKADAEAERKRKALAAAKGSFANATSLRESTPKESSDLLTRRLVDEYNAAYKLSKLTGQSDTDALAALEKRLAGHKEELAIFSELEKKRKRIEDAKSRVDFDRDQGFAGADKLRNLRAYRDILRDTNKDFAGLNTGELKDINSQINSLVDKGERKRIGSELLKVKGAANQGDPDALKARIKLNQELEQLTNKSRASQIAADRKALETSKELTAAEKKQADVLTDLLLKTKAYEAAVSELNANGPDLTHKRWKALVATIDDYGNAIKRASRLQEKDGPLSGGLEKTVAGYTKLSSALRDVSEQQSKLNDAALKYQAALGPKDQLAAATEMSRALAGVAQARVRSGGYSPESLRDLKVRQVEVEGLVQRAKELVIANNQAASSYNSLNGVMRSFFRYAVEFSLLYKAQQAIIDMVTSVVQLEDALKATQAISRSTDAEMQKVSSSVEQVAIDTEYSTNEIAAAAQTLAQAGVDIREVGDALEYVALASSATNSSIATTTDIMTTMMNVFKDMSFQEIADQMTATINLSKLTGEELSTILSRAVEVSETFNIVPEQMNAAFAVLRNSGIKASTISTGYRQALLEVFSPDEKTLRFLEKRYAELGQNMSQGTIAALFQSFARAEDPIRAVTEELEKLGYGTSQAAEFARVFDVRATNVLDVLVKQRDEYIKLTTQIDNHGAALKGNQTQMESLSKSWENLGSIITVVANDAFGGMLGTLEKIVDNLGDIIELGGKAMNTLREGTGSSGVGSSLLAGLLGGVSRYTKTGSIASSIGRGTGIAATSEVLQLGIGTTISDTLASVIGNVGVAFAAADLLKGRFGKKKGEGAGPAPKSSSRRGSKAALPGKRGITSQVFDTVEDAVSDPKVGLAATLASSAMEMVSSLAGWFKNLPKAFMAMGPLGWTAAAASLLFTALELLNKDVAVQIDAIRSRVEGANKKIKKLQDEAEGNRKDVQQVEDLRTSVDTAQSGMSNFFRAGTEGLDKTNEEIIDATSELDGVSFDLGSSGLAEGLKRLQSRLGVLFSPTMDQRDIINEINRTKAEVDKVEGNRAAWQQQLLEAYETDANDRTKQQQALISTFDKFTSAEKASISNRIKNLNEAKKYLDLAGALSQAKDTGLQVDLAAQKGIAQKGRGDIAKLEVERSIKETGGLQGLTGLILQASKDGDVQLISDLREAVQEFRPALDAEVFATAGTPYNPNLPKIDKAPTLQFLSEVQAASAKSSAEEMASNLAELAKETDAQIDHFRNALTPDQATALGLPGSAVQQAERATAEFLADVPDAWKVAYHNATGMGRSTEESLKYLEKTKNTLGDFPPALEKEYQILQRRLVEQEGGRKAAADALLAQNKLRKVGEEIQKEMDRVQADIKLQAPLADAGDQTARDKLKTLTAEEISLQEKYNAFRAEYLKAAADSKNKSSAAGAPILDEETSLTRVRQTYEHLDNVNKKSASERELLEQERNRLTELDIQDRIRTLDLNSKIYDLRMRESRNIEESAKDALLRSKALAKEMGHTAESYEEIADWFNSASGQAFLKSHQVEALHLSRLTEAVRDQELARRELSQRLVDEGRAIDARVARDASALDVKTQEASRAVDRDSGRDIAKTAAEETKVVLDEIKARQGMELKASDEKVALYQEQAKAGRISQVELTKATETELANQLQSRKDYLSKALAEEKRHLDNVRNLKQSLRDNSTQEREFYNQFNKQAMQNAGANQADLLRFDAASALLTYGSARRELLFGDKVNGLKDMNAAIAQQQTLVTELQRAEAEGVVSWIDTSDAYQNLLVMYEARRRATEEQLAKEEAARKAASDAADAQLQAINALVEALNRLAERLASMPTLDLGVEGSAPQDPGQPQQAEGSTKGVTGVDTYNDLRYETTVDQDGKVTYSPVKKYAEGGLVTGPGTGTSDSVLARVSKDEYILPADVTRQVGLPFLESLRKGMPDVNRRVGEMLPNKALANMMSPNAAQKQENMQTAIFQLGDATIQTKAQPSAVQEFQAAFKVQSLKKGRRA
jgi:TP901 family phage tail tape measure protein